ncbi:hypothetical protein L7F22_021048 [Adiantum nelumboides]|nr:hypothetical protein [Adiantum nelumboides]
MEGSIIGGPILSAPEAGVLDLDPALHHHPLHHQQALSHHLQGLAPLSSTQHLNLGQDLDSSLGFDASKSLLLCGKGKSVATSDEMTSQASQMMGMVIWVGRVKRASLAAYEMD